MSKTYNTHEAKTNLSQLLSELESGAENEFIIARGGRPIALLVPKTAKKGGITIGVARGKLIAPPIDTELDLAASSMFVRDLHEDTN